MSGSDETAEAFAARAARRLRPDPPGLDEALRDPRGDHRLDRLPHAPAESLKPAAVLVPVTLRGDGPSVILTERAAGLRDHSGQIAFPGGKVDRGETPLAAALREAEEEVGLHRRHVRPLGYLDGYLSSSSYFVTPVVAAVSAEAELAVNALEVAEAFEAPLAFLMDAGNHELHSREWKGAMRRYWAIPFQHRYIWGLTAGILRNMYERLYAP